MNDALFEKQPEWARKYGKVILLYDNAPSHTAKLLKDSLKALYWEVLVYPQYSPDLAPSDYLLILSMGHALAEQHFVPTKKSKSESRNGLRQKTTDFLAWCPQMLESWPKCLESNSDNFE